LRFCVFFFSYLFSCALAVLAFLRRLTVSPLSHPTRNRYNFYLFPEEGKDLTLSLSAINFLRQNSMDFGKWITEGIPYVHSARAEQLQVGEISALIFLTTRIFLTEPCSYCTDISYGTLLLIVLLFVIAELCSYGTDISY
jgi:hypothetical protein